MRDRYDDPDARFTKAEHDALLAMLEQDRRVAWFWGSVRVWAGWISGAMGGAAALYVAWQKYFNGHP